MFGSEGGGEERVEGKFGEGDGIEAEGLGACGLLRNVGELLSVYRCGDFHAKLPLEQIGSEGRVSCNGVNAIGA